MGDPIQNVLHFREQSEWFLYGSAPFNFETALQKPEDGADATVLLNHSYESDFWGYDCSTCCPCKPIYDYTYTGKVTNQNLGNNATIAASAYDWGKEFDFPVGKYLRIYRSFFKFDFSKFKLSSTFINNGTLDFWGTGSKVDPDGPYGFTFHLSPVIGNWSEHDVTWASQPNVTEAIATLKNPKTQPYGYVLEHYQVPVKDLVRAWVSNPEYNYGLRLNLQEEETNLELDYASNRKRVMIAGSDEGGPNPYYTKVDLKFANPNYNPQNFVIDAGHVEPGDTVLIALNNGNTRRPVAIGGRAETFQIESDSIDGYVLPFEDRFKNTTNRPIAYSGEEQIQAFVYIGEKEEEMRLAIVVPEQEELWPTIPSGGAQVGFDRSQVKNAIEGIIVEVTQEEEPVPNHPVTITAEWVQDSGEHNHKGADDLKKPPQEKMGLLEDEYGISGKGKLKTTTNEFGVINLKYTTPEFGGEILLNAKTPTADGDTIKVQDQFSIQVPNLVLLPDSEEYKKIGGTSSHNGPPFYQNDNNHYGTKAFVNSLASIAETWNELAEQDSIDEGQTPLHFNDLSLPKGGLFDITGEWRPSHDYHRIGKDVEIRTTRIKLSDSGGRIGVLLKPVEISGRIRYRNRVFEDLCVDKGVYPRPRVHGEGKKQEHYHVYFYSDN